MSVSTEEKAYAHHTSTGCFFLTATAPTGQEKREFKVINDRVRRAFDYTKTFVCSN